MVEANIASQDAQPDARQSGQQKHGPGTGRQSDDAPGDESPVEERLIQFLTGAHDKLHEGAGPARARKEANRISKLRRTIAVSPLS